MIRESDIEKYLVEQVTKHGGEIRKLKWIGRRGAMDRVVLFPHVLVWVELKAPGEEPEPHQEREHRRFRNMGQIVQVVDSFTGVDRVVYSAVQASLAMRLLKEEAVGNA